MRLAKTYEIEAGPSVAAVEAYSSGTEAEFFKLIDSKPSEQEVQRFLEQHPAMVPGARTPGSPSGHAQLHSVLISQPELPGLSSKYPDFMWIASHSQSWYPTLIEIERPDKRLFKSNLVPTAEFTQAYNQLAQWRTWFDEPENVLTLIREYGVPEDIHRYWARKLHMILVYGRRHEFEGNPVMSKQRSALVQGDDEEIISYDRLRVDRDLTDMITVRGRGSGKYQALCIPSTFTLGPLSAERLLRIDKLEEAIQQADISPERVKFLIERLKYWRDWASHGNSGIVNAADRE